MPCQSDLMGLPNRPAHGHSGAKPLDGVAGLGLDFEALEIEAVLLRRGLPGGEISERCDVVHAKSSLLLQRWDLRRDFGTGSNVAEQVFSETEAHPRILHGNERYDRRAGTGKLAGPQHDLA